MPASNKKTVRISGQIIPRDYDDDGAVNGLLLVDDEDNEYTIQTGGKGSHLLDYIDEYVSVKGVLKKAGGEFNILVNDFEVIEDEDDDYDDDDDDDDEEYFD